ncbi:MAG: hypothetical protein U0984_10440 [Prosthecobacter sp.]|nr:hypothetical protein [Prosthecobacter sp.]
MKTLARISALLLLSAACLSANDEAVVDSDLPQPLDLGFAESLVAQSPFSRSVNLEESLQLTGIAYVNGRPVATVLNKATKERIVVSEEPNAQGWTLTEAIAGADLSNSEVSIMVGPEIVTMHYNNSQIEPGSGAKGNSSRMASSGGSGDKFRVSNYLGENGKQLYVSLSPEGRDKLKDLVKAHLEKRPELTPEQSSAYAQKVFAKIKETDHAAAGSKASKPAKTSTKKKQGA